MNLFRIQSNESMCDTHLPNYIFKYIFILIMKKVGITSSVKNIKRQ